MCLTFLGLCLFFFKQKTAYEMRISDWSSDVCSSDLVFNGDLSKVYDKQRPTRVAVDGLNHDIGDGDVVIAAITSCTNTSNPSVLIAAGLVARKARAKGLKPKPWVKTSLEIGRAHV